MHIDEALDGANYVKKVDFGVYIYFVEGFLSSECVPVALITCNNHVTLTTFVALVGTLN